jgi:hypothetical protein
MRVQEVRRLQIKQAAVHKQLQQDYQEEANTAWKAAPGAYR